MTPDVNQKRTVHVEVAAKLLGISRRSAYDAVHRGEIPSIRVGRRILVPTASLRRLLGICDENDSPEAPHHVVDGLGL